MLSNLLEYLKAFFWWILTPLSEAVKFLAWYFFDKFCMLIEFIFSILSLPGDLMMGAFDWAGLPGPVLYVLNAVGLSSGISILTSALGARMLLNLIPSWASRI